MRVRVYYADTDAGGVVYYANYLRWFEMARYEFVQSLGVSVVDLAKEGFQFAVVHIEIDYHTPALLGEELEIVTEVTEVRRVRFSVRNRVLRCSDQRELVVAHLTLACLDPRAKILALPAKLSDRLRDCLRIHENQPPTSACGE